MVKSRPATVDLPSHLGPNLEYVQYHLTGLVPRGREPDSPPARPRQDFSRVLRFCSELSVETLNSGPLFPLGPPTPTCRIGPLPTAAVRQGPTSSCSSGCPHSCPSVEFLLFFIFSTYLDVRGDKIPLMIQTLLQCKNGPIGRAKHGREKNNELLFSRPSPEYMEPRAPDRTEKNGCCMGDGNFSFSFSTSFSDFSTLLRSLPSDSVVS
ncbi:hypothetical protein VTK26DRAFT_8506 [Humicola hyalothermophila]